MEMHEYYQGDVEDILAVMQYDLPTAEQRIRKLIADVERRAIEDQDSPWETKCEELEDALDDAKSDLNTFELMVRDIEGELDLAEAGIEALDDSELDRDVTDIFDLFTSIRRLIKRYREAL